MTAWSASCADRGDDTLTGGAGNDTLFGGARADTFIFDATQAGTDHVVGLEAWDQAVIENAPWSDISEIMAMLVQEGHDVVLDLGAAQRSGKIVFDNTYLHEIRSDLFLLE
ncbi:hypothetical protein [Sagittula salina]|uniref:Uncharacterized protein n=1 Tax=Sagittula salina TaxID=2820268 RepID=A0A940MX57_9RHOB|nr:hypothetical protein [Sagittula salina]MBP0484499.1 hypothetical protein [Sagittula salina]